MSDSMFFLQHDSGIARLLFSSLFSGIVGEMDEVLTDREVTETVATLQRCVNTALDNSSQYYPPFVGCLLVGSSFARHLV